MIFIIKYHYRQGMISMYKYIRSDKLRGKDKIRKINFMQLLINE